MTSQPKKATLSEWAAKFEALIGEMQDDGVSVNPTSCCCGEGVVLTRVGESGEWVL